MTQRVIILIFSMVVLAAYTSASAQDAPEITEPGKSPATEKVTYLGLTTKAVDADLQAQLKLPDGVGLVVTFVDSKGPAAGQVQAGDVLQKLDDQILIDTHQLVTLVRMHHAGDSVSLSVIHETKPATVTIKLGEKEHHVVAAEPDPNSDRTYTLPGLPNPDFDYQLPTTTNTQMAFDDGVYSARITPDKNGVRQMVVKDKNGAVAAAGPVDTEAQWNAFPDDIRKHLEVLHKMVFKNRGK